MAASIKDYKLFTPLTLAEGLTLKNRVVLSPLTRARTDIDTHTPNEDTAVYYEQRAGAGLIVTEGVAISPQAFGWYGAPALYNDEHAAAWRNVVERVHKRDGKIFLQLWHMSRQGHPSPALNGDVVSASANGYTEGRTRNNKGESVHFEMARALDTDEIPGVIEDFRRCAERAKEVGFDGVEILAGGGYSIDTFLQSCTNQRTDKYGGSFANRARFLFEIIDAIKTVWPADRIGVRIRPNGAYGGMGSEDNPEMFTHLLEELGRSPVGYVAILDGQEWGVTDKCRLMTVFDVKQAYKGTVLATACYTRDTAEGAIRSGAADFVGFGRMHMSNPDLAERFLNDWPLNPELERKYWWDASMGTEGYTSFSAYTP